MLQEDMDKLLNCRKLIDSFWKELSGATTDEEKAQVQKKILEDLLVYGFKDVSEFKKFNDNMNFQTHRECRPIKGSCDLCGETEMKDQPCVKLFGMVNACAVNKPQTPLENMYKLSFLNYIKRGGICVEPVDGVRKLVCPDGHGFYVLTADDKEFPFDFTWRL